MWALSKYAVRAAREESRREEKKQFFRDVHISGWDWDPRFWTVAGILAGKELEPWSYRRWYALGWVRPIERSPFYELTCRGEEARLEGRDLLEEDEYDESDWSDD